MNLFIGHPKLLPSTGSLHLQMSGVYGATQPSPGTSFGSGRRTSSEMWMGTIGVTLLHAGTVLGPADREMKTRSCQEGFKIQHTQALWDLLSLSPGVRAQRAF